MFALRAHQLYTNQTWFDLVQAIEYNNTLYWDDTCGGGVLWLTYRPMIKNTITNGCVKRKRAKQQRSVHSGRKQSRS